MRLGSEFNTNDTYRIQPNWRDTIEDHVSNDLGLLSNPANMSMAGQNIFANNLQYTSDQVINQPTKALKTYSGFNEQLIGQPNDAQYVLPDSVHYRNTQIPRYENYEVPQDRGSLGFFDKLKESIIDLLTPSPIVQNVDPNQNPEVTNQLIIGVFTSSSLSRSSSEK